MAKVPLNVDDYNKFIPQINKKDVKGLPQDTRSWLFDLITRKAPNAQMEKLTANDPFGGTISSGVSVVKYGWTANMPPGAATGPNPGKNRLVRRIEGGANFWFVGEHMGPSNSYRFYLINLPACKSCSGTKEIICPTCGGCGKITQTSDLLKYIVGMPCPTCRKGVKECAACAASGGPFIANGRAVEGRFNEWT